MENPIQTESKNSNTGKIIGISVAVVVALLCCCAVIVIGALTMMGPAVGNVFSSVNRDIALTAIPDFPTISPDMTLPSIEDFPTLSPDATLPTLDDVIPTGGNGDYGQRASAWTYVLLAAATDGCSYSLKAPETTIKVTQEADADGVWAEDWTVKCDSGSEKTYNVTFTPGANGDIDISIK